MQRHRHEAESGVIHKLVQCQTHEEYEYSAMAYGKTVVDKKELTTKSYMMRQ
jgi:hypothetical protein